MIQNLQKHRSKKKSFPGYCYRGQRQIFRDDLTAFKVKSNIHMHILMYGGESIVMLHWYIIADEEDQEIMQLIKYLEMKREIRELRENVS